MALGNNKSFLEDSLEKIAEVGAGTVKQGAQAITKTTDPSSILRSLYGIPESATNPNDASGDKAKEKLEKSSKPGDNHTPLDKNKLEGKYQDQDAMKLADARRHFKWYQNQQQDFLAKKNRADQQKHQHELQAEEQKKKQREEERRQKEQGGDGEAHGKQKQVLGQPRRKATTEIHPETKAGGAK